MNARDGRFFSNAQRHRSVPRRPVDCGPVDTPDGHTTLSARLPPPREEVCDTVDRMIRNTR